MYHLLINLLAFFVFLTNRDIKPGNLLLFTENRQKALDWKSVPVNTLVLKITDFGLSRYLSQSPSTSMSNNRGTLEFMAPEVRQAMYDAKKSLRQVGIQMTDIWSAGVVTYYMFKGSAPGEHANSKS